MPSVLLSLTFLLTGCGLPRCEEMCAVKADCLEGEIEDYDSNWSSFTGFDSRADYEQACLAVFEDGRDEGASRKDQQKVCRAELERGCDVPTR